MWATLAVIDLPLGDGLYHPYCTSGNFGDCLFLGLPHYVCSKRFGQMPVLQGGAESFFLMPANATCYCLISNFDAKNAKKPGAILCLLKDDKHTSSPSCSPIDSQLPELRTQL